MEFYLIKWQPLGFFSVVSDRRSQDDDAAREECGGLVWVAKGRQGAGARNKMLDEN